LTTTSRDDVGLGDPGEPAGYGLAGADAGSDRRERLRSRIYTLADMLREETEEAEPLLGNFLRKGQVTILGGHGGQGKSTMGIEMGRATVTGADFLGATGEGSKALFVDMEQGIGVAQRAFMRSFYPDGYEEGPAVSDLAAEMELGEVAERRIRWADWREGAGPEGWDDMFAVIEEEIITNEPDLVVLDPVYKLMMGSKTSEEEIVGRLIHHVDSIRARRPLVSWLIPMHPRKPPSMSGQTCPNVSDLYGSALWGWWAGQIFLIQRTTGQGAMLRIGKDRMGLMALEDWTLELRPGKGYRRATGDAGSEGPRTPEAKIWQLLQQHSPQTFTRKELSGILLASQKVIIRATKKLEEQNGLGRYPGLVIEVGANNTHLYGYKASGDDLVIENIRQELGATEEDA
jgi:hypothetical protein